jgi:hypothetical protein
MKEIDWLLPSLVLTIFSALFAIVMIPSYAGILPALGILPWWMKAAAILASIYGVVAMVSARVPSPISHVSRYFIAEWHKPVFLTLCMLLAGINMITFMWMKPLLNYLVPFWADPMLASLDHALFLGHDPWVLLTWLNSTPTAIFYHRIWFALMILTLLVVLSAAPSPRKSAVMLTYFVLWSVVGPLVHTLLPAAGPVFYAQLGYGDRFAGLHGVPETMEVANYLWAIYAGEGFGPGSGISAMPSLHIATTVWMLIAVHVFARRWFVPMAVTGAAIFLLSISLGWHYAIDGVVGGGAAWLCYRLLHAFYRDRRPWSREVAVAA